MGSNGYKNAFTVLKRNRDTGREYTRDPFSSECPKTLHRRKKNPPIVDKLRGISNAEWISEKVKMIASAHEAVRRAPEPQLPMAFHGTFNPRYMGTHPDIVGLLSPWGTRKTSSTLYPCSSHYSAVLNNAHRNPKPPPEATLSRAPLLPRPKYISTMHLVEIRDSLKKVAFS